MTRLAGSSSAGRKRNVARIPSLEAEGNSHTITPRRRLSSGHRSVQIGPNYGNSGKALAALTIHL
jgi:hypothetical protein